MQSKDNSIKNTSFKFKGQIGKYTGKVRDVYRVGELLVMIATDRISAFDHVLPRAIPFKGQVLNQTALHFLKATEDIVPNWVLGVPHPNVAIGHACIPIKLEMVIRGYLTGHAWREYASGKRTICGVAMPEGMKEHDPFPEPIITPSTKADEGHDIDITREEIIRDRIVSEDVMTQLEFYTRSLFQRGTEMAAERGLILVDTKYEFGMRDGRIILIDEIHTPDSSRFFYLDGYEERQAKGAAQPQLSKEFVREWLMENNFQGLEGQSMPFMDDAFVQLISERYIALYEQITGETFVKTDSKDIINDMKAAVDKSLERWTS